MICFRGKYSAAGTTGRRSGLNTAIIFVRIVWLLAFQKKGVWVYVCWPHSFQKKKKKRSGGISSIMGLVGLWFNWCLHRES